MLRRKLVSVGIVSVMLFSLVLTGCSSERTAQLLVQLPDYCNTPDGMALMPDGSFLLSVPNYNDPSPGAFIMKVSARNKVSKFFIPPAHPKTGTAAPMGICLAPSGDVYYADNLFGPETPQTSRVMRIVVQDGKAQEAVTVVSGLNVANAVAIKGDYLYVSETIMVPGSTPLISGIFRFKIGDEGIQLKTPLETDPHLIATIKSYNDA
ncbi:MAG: NHL repeat-containing protein, partial [Planctomycetota bacterium]